MADIKQTLEGEIGLKCDEVFLEDSAVRFLKDSFLKKGCSCPHLEYIFVNLDDTNINLKRLMTTIKFLCVDQKKEVYVHGCSYNRDSQQLCVKNGAKFIEMPIEAQKLKRILLE